MARLVCALCGRPFTKQATNRRHLLCRYVQRERLNLEDAVTITPRTPRASPPKGKQKLSRKAISPTRRNTANSAERHFDRRLNLLRQFAEPDDDVNGRAGKRASRSQPSRFQPRQSSKTPSIPVRALRIIPASWALRLPTQSKAPKDGGEENVAADDATDDTSTSTREDQDDWSSSAGDGTDATSVSSEDHEEEKQ